MSASMGSSIIQSRSWHEYSASNEPEQQDATLASSGVKIPVNVKMSASMGSSIIQSRSWHEQQDATLATSGVKIPVNVKMSASMGSSIIQSRSWHEDSGSNEPEQWHAHESDLYRALYQPIGCCNMFLCISYLHWNSSKLKTHESPPITFIQFVKLFWKVPNSTAVCW